MLSAANEVREHDTRQDRRINELSTSSGGRLDALEDKTRHMTLEGDGTGDEHHLHGRRLRATDKITAESTAHAVIEAVAGAGQDAKLDLRDGNDDGFQLVSSSAAAELAIKRVNGATATNAVVVNRLNGTVTLGSGLTVTGSTALGDDPNDTVTVNGTLIANNDASGRISFDAGDTTAAIRLFDNSSGAIRIGGGASTSVVEVNKFAISSASGKLTCYLPFSFHQDIKTTAVTGFTGSHTAWTVLGSSSFPTLSFTVAEHDRIQVSGNFAQDTTNYAHIGDLFRLSVRRGSSSGTYISEYNSDHIIASSGGDNSVEHAQVVFPTVTYEITSADAGTVFICWEIIRRDSGAPAVTLVAEGTSYATQASRIMATRLVQVDVPLLQ
jgi:hypothetical protein